MYWLRLVSDSIALLAVMVTLFAWVTSMRRRRAGRLSWQMWVLPALMMAAALFFGAADASHSLAHVLLTLFGRLMILASACLVWLLLRQFTGRAASGAGSLAQAQSSLDLATAEMAELRNLLRLAEKIARVGHWRYTPSDKNLTWSEEMFTIFGLSIVGIKPSLDQFLERVVPGDRALAVAAFETALHDASPFEFTARILQDGEPAGYVTVRGIPEIDDTGTLTALFGVLVDITAQKQIEEDLKAAHKASEMANKALDALARHDALTRLANRRHFDETIVLESKRMAREMSPMGLIMIDLDYFKSFNDHYGHPMGDHCLRDVASAIAAVPQRPADLVARYGGEEIVVLLPNTDLTGTETVAQLIVDAVRALRIPHFGNPEGIVTISCGAAAFEPAKDPYAVVKLVERADEALYNAKRAGRNRAASHAVAA
jgi:diguanylate cyclase (GGDEF)-like protein